jgi:hypothetical protein
LRFDLVADLRPGSFQQCSLDVSQRRSPRPDEVLAAPAANRRQIRVADDAAVKDPHAAGVPVLAFDHQSSDSCRQAKGQWRDSLNASGGTSGTITKGRMLNGTTETVDNPAAVFTLDPNVVSFVAETTVTTNRGLLVTNNVYIYNLVTGLGTALATISSNASTGRFAGATGVLYFNTTETIGVPPDQSYVSTITGTICFGNVR